MTLTAEEPRLKRPVPIPYAEPLTGEKPKAARALWLDAFRGFTMLWLVSRGFGFPRVAHLPGLKPVADQFEHAAWAGMTAWDLVQPFFMFIVGAAMPFAFARRRAEGGTWVGGLGHTLKRCGLLLLWSHVLMIGTGGAWGWQLINVLAQIAFAYLITYFVLDARWAVQAAAAAGLLVLHWALHVFWPGVGPGGPWAQGQNFGTYLDRLVLGKTWPSGYATLNFVTAASATIAGVMAANLLRTSLSFGRKAAMLLAVGAGLVGLGLLLGYVPSAGSPLVPIIKRIWTPSFALLSVGITLWALLAFYAVFTAWPTVPSKLLLAIGANCIFIYIVNMLLGGQVRNVVERLVGPAMHWVLAKISQPAAWTMFVVDWLALGVLAAVAVWLYNRRIFFKL